MTAPRMTYDYLLRTQPKAFYDTRMNLNGAFLEIPKALDALFRLPCLLLTPDHYRRIQRLRPTESDKRWPYCRRGLRPLTRAYYLEAVSLVRGMFEVLVQVRYFDGIGRTTSRASGPLRH